MCATHLLIMLYLSVKFHQICFSSLGDIAETRFVTDGLTDGWFDFNMPPKFLRGHKKPLNYPKSAAVGFFSKGLKNEFETAVVNGPVFEPLKFYCIMNIIHILSHFS